MSNEIFLQQLEIARKLTKERLDALRRGERVQGYEDELLMFLDDFASAGAEARTGRFEMTRDQRSLASARRVLDTWPFDDALASAIMDAENTYTSL
jgi:hypothetical protein